MWNRNRNEKFFEIIAHTADIGLKVYGKSIEALFVNAAKGLFVLIVEVP